MQHSAARLILRFMARYRERVAVGLAMAIAGTLLGFVFPGVTQWFLDDIIPHHKLDRILPAALLAWGAFALRQVFYSLRTVANNAFELRMTYDLRSQLHDKIQHLPLKWFDRQTTGDILTRMADDVPATQRVILDGVDQAAPALLQAMLTMGGMFWLHWKLTLVTLLPLPLIAAGGWIYAHWVSPRARTARQAAGGLNSLLHDNISGIRQIKSYTLEEEKQQDFDVSSDAYRAQQTRLQRAWAVYGPGMGMLGDTGLILLMGFGAWWAIKGEISIGQLGQFLLLIGMLYEPIGRMHGINQTFVNGAASARRVFEILEIDDAEDLKKGEMLGEVRGEIRFENIFFSYDATRPTLTKVNLLVPAQTTVAIVGATGSGKSTLFQLLTRFYEPDRGEILLDGKPIRDLNKASLRDALGYVTQESYLFNQTIRENLKLGKTTATDDELWKALEMACAREFVERMEGQLDAMVGERGSRLSGGEKQRISIARAILKDAPILLLDEATSAVDTKSEKLIQEAVDTLRSHRTCLVIAHRLSTIKNAHEIYVMRHGEVLAHGTHQELLKTCDYYAELTKLSFSAEKLEVE
jgi:ATP-binding cassette subfamily B protein/subfamily B ATP-binding cassette protein MsbA